MEIAIQVKGTTITPSIESAAKAMLKKALSIDECENVKVIVEKTNMKEKSHSFRLTGIIQSKTAEIIVHKLGQDVYKTFHILSDDLARHVRKAKEKRLHKERLAKR